VPRLTPPSPLLPSSLMPPPAPFFSHPRAIWGDTVVCCAANMDVDDLLFLVQGTTLQDDSQASAHISYIT